MTIDDLQEGAEVAGAPRKLTMGRILAFSGGPLAAPGWPARNLHTDQTKAAEAGLSAPIVSGIQCEADVTRLLIQLFGEKAWLETGRLHVKYPRPVFADAQLTAHARVRTRQTNGDSIKVELDVWCDTTEKEMVVVGTASCTAR